MMSFNFKSVLLFVVGVTIAVAGHAADAKKQALNITSDSKIEGFAGDNVISVMPTVKGAPNSIILLVPYNTDEVPKDIFFEHAMRAFYYVFGERSMPQTSGRRTRVSVVGSINQGGKTTGLLKYAVSIPVSKAELASSVYIEDIQNVYSDSYVYNPYNEDNVQLQAETQDFKEFVKTKNPLFLLSKSAGKKREKDCGRYYAGYTGKTNGKASALADQVPFVVRYVNPERGNVTVEWTQSGWGIKKGELKEMSCGTLSINE